MARLDDDKLQEILTLLTEVKADVNGLMNTFLRHDHDSTYAAQALRFNSAANSVVSGTASISSLTNAFPATVRDAYRRG